jgi:hypothetical protein
MLKKCLVNSARLMVQGSKTCDKCFIKPKLQMQKANKMPHFELTMQKYKSVESMLDKRNKLVHSLKHLSLNRLLF